MSLVATKCVFGVSDKARLKPVSSTTETSLKTEISPVASLDIFSKKRITKALIRLRRLVCAFVVHKPRKMGFLMSMPILNSHFALQVLNSRNVSSNFNFLDGNNWPISLEQENHMTVSHILIGCCVHTDIRISAERRSSEFSPPNRPPCKKLKGYVNISFT